MKTQIPRDIFDKIGTYLSGDEANNLKLVCKESNAHSNFRVKQYSEVFNDKIKPYTDELLKLHSEHKDNITGIWKELENHKNPQIAALPTLIGVGQHTALSAYLTALKVVDLFIGKLHKVKPMRASINQGLFKETDSTEIFNNNNQHRLSLESIFTLPLNTLRMADIIGTINQSFFEKAKILGSSDNLKKQFQSRRAIHHFDLKNHTKITSSVVNFFQSYHLDIMFLNKIGCKDDGVLYGETDYLLACQYLEKIAPERFKDLIKDLNEKTGLKEKKQSVNSMISLIEGSPTDSSEVRNFTDKLSETFRAQFCTLLFGAIAQREQAFEDTDLQNILISALKNNIGFKYSDIFPDYKVIPSILAIFLKYGSHITSQDYYHLFRGFQNKYENSSKKIETAFKLLFNHLNFKKEVKASVLQHYIYDVNNNFVVSPEQFALMLSFLMEQGTNKLNIIQLLRSISKLPPDCYTGALVSIHQKYREYPNMKQALVQSLNNYFITSHSIDEGATLKLIELLKELNFSKIEHFNLAVGYLKQSTGSEFIRTHINEADLSGKAVYQLLPFYLQTRKPLKSIIKYFLKILKEKEFVFKIKSIIDVVGYQHIDLFCPKNLDVNDLDLHEFAKASPGLFYKLVLDKTIKVKELKKRNISDGKTVFQNGLTNLHDVKGIIRKFFDSLKSDIDDLFNTTDNAGFTPMHDLLASGALTGTKYAIETLASLKNPNDLLIKKSDSGDTPLSLLLASGKYGYICYKNIYKNYIVKSNDKHLIEESLSIFLNASDMLAGPKYWAALKFIIHATGDSDNEETKKIPDIFLRELLKRDTLDISADVIVRFLKHLPKPSEGEQYIVSNSVKKLLGQKCLKKYHYQVKRLNTDSQTSLNNKNKKFKSSFSPGFFTEHNTRQNERLKTDEIDEIDTVDEDMSDYSPSSQGG